MKPELFCSGLLLCISFHLLKFAVVQAFAQLAETGLLYGNRLLDRAGDPGEAVRLTLHASSSELSVGEQFLIIMWETGVVENLGTGTS